MSCWETLADYGLRSLGIGERLLPRSDFTLCQQVVLIGSGMLWNIYFGTLALLSGFVLATGRGSEYLVHYNYSSVILLPPITAVLLGASILSTPC